MSKYKVAIGAGHGGGGSTPGKRTPDKEFEWVFNDQVVRAFMDHMKKHHSNVEVKRMDDPSGSYDVSLLTRTNSANNWGADVYISIHHNALDEHTWKDNVTGVEVWHQPNNPKSIELAKLVQAANVKAYGLRDRGIKTKNLHITREAKMTAVLSEGGFMDSSIDIKKLRDPKVLIKAGELIAEAVYEFLSGTKTSTDKPSTSKPTPTKPSNDISKKGVETLAKEVRAGLHGDGEQRKKSLGSRYAEVQKRVNEMVASEKNQSKPVKSIETLAKEVRLGLHGNGEQRRKSLGKQYDAVQKRVNELEKSQGVNSGKSFSTLVRETELGLHGNGEQRRKSLGSQYTAVQREVNRRAAAKKK